MKIIFCGFQSISNTDQYFRRATVTKGNHLYAAGHIDSVREVIEDNDSQIYGKCLPQTSINNDVYNLKLQLSKERIITGGSCSCKVGLGGRCKHLAALTIYVNEVREISKTDQRQCWGIPKVKLGYSKGQKIEDMLTMSPCPPKQVPEVSILQVIGQLPDRCPLLLISEAEFRNKEQKECRKVLDDIINAVCEYELDMFLSDVLDNAAKSQIFTYFSTIEDGRLFIRRRRFGLTLHEKVFYETNIPQSRELIKSIAIKTVEQNKSSLWHKVRKIRITASQCHPVWTRRSKFEKLVSIMLNNSFKGNDATKYGNKLEKAARASFAFQKKCQVTELGVIICENYPWLCCSPDGVYKENGSPELLEIKCPYSRKGMKLVDNKTKTSFLHYVVYDGNQFTLKSSCRSVDNLVISLERNDEFISSLINKLEEFYFLYFLPTICKN